MKTLTRNWRDHCRIAHENCIQIFRQAQQSLSIKKIDKDGRACRNILIQFPCAHPTVISSISGKSFHFPFPYFVMFVLRYFPFHVIIIAFTCTICLQYLHFFSDYNLFSLCHISLLLLHLTCDGIVMKCFYTISLLCM